MFIPVELYRSFIRLLWGLLVVLVVSSFVVGIAVVLYEIDSGLIYKWFQLLNLDLERNLPTWFSSTLLALNGLSLLLVAFLVKGRKDGHFVNWFVLGAIFFFLSMDEFIQFHEQIIRPLRNALQTDGLLYNAWIIPAGIFLLILGLSYLPFLLRLPTNIRNRFFLAAFLYVGGALMIEAVGGLYFSSALDAEAGTLDMGYLVITHAEEFMEMSGLLVFLEGLFTYIHQQDFELLPRQVTVESSLSNAVVEPRSTRYPV